MKKTILILLLGLLINSCSISYKFDGASVDYNLVRTISIQDFPNHTAFAPTLSATFSDALRNKYIRQTRLRIVDNNADLELEGEIIGYDLRGLAVREGAFDTMTQLSITVRVRYVNNKKPSDDLQQSFTASRDFPSAIDVPEQLVQEIIDDLIDKIYNATLGNW